MDQQDLQDYGKTFGLTERLSLCTLCGHRAARSESSPFTQGVIQI
jgi:hypothetical protein